MGLGKYLIHGYNSSVKTMEKLRLLAEVTAVQWGMVTSAQAAGRGVSRLDLSRLSTGGHLVRLAHGVYMDVGVPETELDEVRAAWLSTDPKVLADERINAWERGVVVAGRAAASLHGLGDFRVDQFDFVSRIGGRASVRVFAFVGECWKLAM